MFKLVFSVYIIIHAIGDFYCQSDKFAANKQKDFKYVILHSLIYLAVAVVLVLPFWSIPLLIISCALGVAHFVVDCVRYSVSKFCKHESAIYLADQILHIACIAVASYIFVIGGYDIGFAPFIKECMNIVSNNPGAICKWVCLVILLCKPTNVTVKKLTAKYAPQYITPDHDTKVDSVINAVERIIIMLLFRVGQFVLVGLVLLADAIFRTKLAEDRKAAAYYLLGALYSTLIVIGAYYILV